MRLKETFEQLWSSQRSLLTLLGVLLVLNLLLFALLEQFLVPRVAEQEYRFLQRQAEVRQLMHKQSGAAGTPEQLFVLANQDILRFQQAVPDYQEFTGLIEELLVLSSRARLNITQISYSTEELKKSPLLKFNLKFNVFDKGRDVQLSVLFKFCGYCRVNPCPCWSHFFCFSFLFRYHKNTRQINLLFY